jgi:hypothetical protein
VATSVFDVADHCPAARVVDRVLGAAVADSSALQQRLIVTLRNFDEQCRATQFHTRSATMLEALLLLCHNSRSDVFVGEIAEVANAIFEGRGDNIKLSARAGGDILREQFGLVGRRQNYGFQLGLDLETQRHVHRLGIAYHVLEPVDECQHCRGLRAAQTDG